MSWRVETSHARGLALYVRWGVDTTLAAKPIPKILALAVGYMTT
jgi:hypothetical protein